MLISAKQRGQGLLEYALIITLVAIIVLVILALLGPAIGSLFSNTTWNPFGYALPGGSLILLWPFSP